MVNCVVCGRSKTARTKLQNLSLHRFPTKLETRKAWIEFVGLPNWQPTKNSLMCSQHFEENCFDKYSVNRVQLKTGAVPTIRITRFKYDRNMIILDISKSFEYTAEEDQASKVPDTSIEEDLATILLEQEKQREKIQQLQRYCLYQQKKILNLHSTVNELQKNPLLSENYDATIS